MVQLRDYAPIEKILSKEGFEITNDPSLASAVIINTCGFLQEAEEESCETIADFCQLRKEGQIDALVVWGCLVSRRRDALPTQAPFDAVDAWFSVQEMDRVAPTVKRLLLREYPLQLPLGKGEGEERPPLNLPLKGGESLPCPGVRVGERLLATPRHTAYLRIADGCDNRCSYCTIPDIRGPYQSLPLDEVFEQARALADAGAVELNLIAQDTTRYGTDLYGEPQIAELLQRLGGLASVRWVRVMYAHPAMVTDAFIETLASTPNVCRYLDLPIQHAADPVLEAMKRRVTRKDLERIVHNLRTRVPGITLRTTVMVGFPGETKKDFLALLGFLRSFPFDHVGVFPYSREDGTPAFDMKSQIPDRVIEERLSRLREDIEFDCEQRKSHLLGECVDVLIDGPCPGKDHWFHGRWEGQAPDVDGHVYLQKEGLAPGTFVPTLLTHLVGSDFTGASVQEHSTSGFTPLLGQDEGGNSC